MMGDRYPTLSSITTYTGDISPVLSGGSPYQTPAWRLGYFLLTRISVVALIEPLTQTLAWMYEAFFLIKKKIGKLRSQSFTEMFSGTIFSFRMAITRTNTSIPILQDSRLGAMV